MLDFKNLQDAFLGTLTGYLKESIEYWSEDGVTNVVQTFWDNAWSWSYNKNANHV